MTPWVDKDAISAKVQGDVSAMGEITKALVADLVRDDAAMEKLAAWLAPHLARLEPDPTGWLPPAAAAEHLGVTRKRIYDLKSSGAIPPDGYDGRTPLWLRETLDAYVIGGRP